MYEVPFKREDQVTVMFTKPYKEALQRLAQNHGTDMSNYVRQAVAEHIQTHHEGEFNRLYDEILQDFKLGKGVR